MDNQNEWLGQNARLELTCIVSTLITGVVSRLLSHKQVETVFETMDILLLQLPKLFITRMGYEIGVIWVELENVAPIDGIHAPPQLILPGKRVFQVDLTLA